MQPIANATQKKLSLWLNLILEWNRHMDFTAARSEEEFFNLMLMDALILASAIPAKEGEAYKIIDVGSGAGAPGLALAILRPDLDLCLVEPNAKRTSFLNIAKMKLELHNVCIWRGKGEDFFGVTPDEVAKSLKMEDTGFDLAISRATWPPHKWLRFGLNMIKNEGQVLVFLARSSEPISEEATCVKRIHYKWPMSQDYGGEAVLRSCLFFCRNNSKL